MGDDLEKAWSKYQEGVDEINKNGELAKEYTDLMIKIIDGNLPKNELQETTKKACKLEKELMKIYPTVYKEPSSVCK
ncbi:hypothetical protein ACTHPF_26830 [Paenibacillus sp. SAF-054]|uniref:hypothetical protein n=1 Tax=unclassified Paenibacillus TaxID=185978 RepID=UPI003F7D4132